MTDLFEEIPNTDDFWVEIAGGVPIESHFDVSAYLNARDDWVEKLKFEYHKAETAVDYLMDVSLKSGKKLKAIEEAFIYYFGDIDTDVINNEDFEATENDPKYSFKFANATRKILEEESKGD